MSEGPGRGKGRGKLFPRREERRSFDGSTVHASTHEGSTDCFIYVSGPWHIFNNPQTNTHAHIPATASCVLLLVLYFELTNSIYADNYSCLYSPPLGPQRPHESIEPHHLTEEQLEQPVHHKTCGCISRLGLTMNLLCVCVYIYICASVCVCVCLCIYM